MAGKGPEITAVKCLAFGHPSREDAYLSITRADNTTERFAMTPSIVRLLNKEAAELNYKWNGAEDAA